VPCGQIGRTESLSARSPLGPQITVCEIEGARTILALMLAALPPKISTCHRSLAIGFCLGVPIGVIMLAIIIAISLAIGRWFGAP
jgi:ABC-type antimicrobial peptide transport system permease subunit